MPKKKIIPGDIDGVYDDEQATCHLIRAFVYSKGNAKTGSVSNKFCNIEILKANDLFYLAITSGRLGASENNALVRRLNSETMMKKVFLDECAKREKSGYSQVEVISIYPNCSAAAKKFVSQRNVISKEQAHEIKRQSKVTEDRNAVNTSKFEPEQSVHPKVEKLVKSIYNEANQTIKESLNPASFQRGDTPLGMININMINRGRQILVELAKNVDGLSKVKNNQQMYLMNIENLSNQYNSTIPRVLKRGNDDWFLNTGDKLQAQLDLLDILEYGISNAVLKSGFTSDIVKMYNALNSDITYVTDESIIKDIIYKMKQEQLANHHFKTKLLNVYAVDQKNAPNFDSSCGNVVTLFHGTRAANLMGILSTHIKLPQNLGPNIHITGAMFGPGVYFGQYSKSLQYSTARFGGQKNKGKKYYLLLCDVALGKMKFEYGSKSYAKAPSGYNSVMGVGHDAFVDGCYIKGIGGTSDLKISKQTFIRESSNSGRGSMYSQLLHNEFIVYAQNKFKIKYIVEVEEAQ